MKKLTGAALMTALLLTGCSGQADPTAYPSAPPDYKLYDTDNLHNEAAWNTSNVHDPSILKDGDTYYIYSTDVKVGGTGTPGIMVRKSKDLISWEWVGYAFVGVPEEAETWTGATGLWAPDIEKFGDTYYLYYSASTFGSNTSYIGVATSSSPEGPWTDQGEVVKTSGVDDPNAIDPNIVLDADGKAWFVYGSFLAGFTYRRLIKRQASLRSPASVRRLLPAAGRWSKARWKDLMSSIIPSRKNIIYSFRTTLYPPITMFGLGARNR